MSVNVAGRPGGDDWETACSLTKGEYILDSGYGADFGEPFYIHGTGLDPIPFRKRDIRSYDVTAGSIQCFGVFVDIREAVSGWSAEDFALKGRHFAKREVAALLIGAIKSKNMHSSTAVELMDTLIPANGGFEAMTSTGQWSLGKALASIRAGEFGYIWVDPDYEKAIIDGAF